jgi:mRNA-degrading endonuclease RelE of RelBE toxin-antitoxin system
MPSLIVSNIFEKSLKKLPKDTLKKIEKVKRLIQENPHHPSLHLKKIQESVRKDVFECRVDDFWRMVLRQDEGNKYDLIYVGPHDKAIKYGAGLREAPAYYGADENLAIVLNLYLAGDEKAIVFIEIVDEVFMKWMEE